MLNRRDLIMTGASAGMMLGAASANAAVKSAASSCNLSIMSEPRPVPDQVPAKEGMAELPGTRLYYWDTGGTGEPIILLHALTGSAANWGYQQPVFAKAGYRVIGYSRRGHFRSDPHSPDSPGYAVDDLNNLADFLGVKKFHMVASAGGSIIALDYLMSSAERLRSLVFACSIGGLLDADMKAQVAALMPKGLSEMPADFRELGPAYRAANRQGTQQWLALEHQALVAERPPVKNRNEVSWERLQEIKVPTLVLSGAADLLAPPAVMQHYVEHLPNSQMATIPEAGHSAYWEAPLQFNQLVLEFLKRHRV